MTAVIVTYNSARVLPTILDGLTGSVELDVCVVDNNSRDGTAELARRHGANVVALDRNSGYGGACNAAVAASSFASDWYAFLNPDLQLSHADLLRCAQDAPADVGCLSPLLIGVNGEQLSDIARPFPRLLAVSLSYLFSARADIFARRTAASLEATADRYFYPDATSGACMLVRRAVYEEIGGFLPDYFFAGEDLDLCYRVHQHGWRVAVDKGVAVGHAKGTSSSGTSASAKHLECARAQVKYFELNGSAAQTVVSSVAVLGGIFARALVRPGVWDSTVAHPYRVLTRELTAMSVRSLRGQRRREIARPLFVPE